MKKLLLFTALLLAGCSSQSAEIQSIAFHGLPCDGGECYYSCSTENGSMSCNAVYLDFEANVGGETVNEEGTFTIGTGEDPLFVTCIEYLPKKLPSRDNWIVMLSANCPATWVTFNNL